MSPWSTIENEIIQVLAGLRANEGPLLAHVAACTARDRKEVAEQIVRQAMPAALIMIAGRDRGDRQYGHAGRAFIEVILATRSLRRDAEARTGLDGNGGLWAIAHQVASALDNRTIAATWRSGLIDEKPAGGAEGTILWLQRYDLHRPAKVSAPTYGGVALAGAMAHVDVQVGNLQQATSSFAFPGMDGVFIRSLGTRDREIVWSGELRAETDTAMNGIEAAIENEIHMGLEKNMVDPWSRAYESCIVKTFSSNGPRSRDELSGQVRQSFKIHFVQLGR